MLQALNIYVELPDALRLAALENLAPHLTSLALGMPGGLGMPCHAVAYLMEHFKKSLVGLTLRYVQLGLQIGLASACMAALQPVGVGHRTPSTPQDRRLNF